MKGPSPVVSTPAAPVYPRTITFSGPKKAAKKAAKGLGGKKGMKRI
jgi:hypothetical protein